MMKSDMHSLCWEVSCGRLWFRVVTVEHLYLFTFSRVRDPREDGHAHTQVEQQNADFTVTVLQGRHKELLRLHHWLKKRYIHAKKMFLVCPKIDLLVWLFYLQTSSAYNNYTSNIVFLSLNFHLSMEAV